MHDVLIALAFLGMLMLPSIFALRGDKGDQLN